MNEYGFFLFIYLFIFGCVGSLLLRACFSLVVVSGGLSCCRARALGTRASVVGARGLSSCGLRALERRLSGCGAGA